MRVSTNMTADAMLTSISGAYERFTKAQQTVGTGKQLNQPSDDPNGLTLALSLQNAIDNMDQYKSTIDNARGFMGVTDNALGEIATTLRQARTIALQGATDSIDLPMRNSLQDQVNTLIEQLKVVANSTYGSRFVFGGQRTTQPALVDNAGVLTYQGGTAATFDDKLTVEIGQGNNLQTNVTGDTVIMPAITALQALRAHIQSDDPVAISTVDLKTLDDTIQGVLDTRADYGARIQRLQGAQTQIDKSTIDFKDYLSKITDADIPKAALDLQTAELTYQGALAATARGFQQSLLDFLK